MARPTTFVRISKVFNNRLLKRKQMVVTIVEDGKPTASRESVCQELSKIFSVPVKLVSVFGLKSGFGGGKVTGFALIYDDADSMKKIEPKYRQRRLIKNADDVIKTPRKQRKERKNRAKKVRGTKQSTKKSKK